VQAYIGDTATELFLASCVYARLCGLAETPATDEAARKREVQTGVFYLRAAHRRNADRFRSLADNDDADQKATAELWLK
jgi:hypothetical protein